MPLGGTNQEPSFRVPRHGQYAELVQDTSFTERGRRQVVIMLPWLVRRSRGVITSLFVPEWGEQTFPTLPWQKWRLSLHYSTTHTSSCMFCTQIHGLAIATQTWITANTCTNYCVVTVPADQMVLPWSLSGQAGTQPSNMSQRSLVPMLENDDFDFAV